jgi:methylmalonyl-CoA mutase N-terminal domain/subunit
VVNTVDPLAGSYFVEAQTNRLERQAYAYFRRIEDLGGVLPAIEAGFFQREIAESAYCFQREIDERRCTIVAVNEYVADEPLTIPILEMDPAGCRRQIARLQALRQARDNERVGAALAALRQAAAGTANLMPPILEAVRAYATLGEITDVLRAVFGVYQETVVV